MTELPATVSTLAQYAEWIERVCDLFTDEQSNECPPLWFRGVGDESYQLIPGLYRREDGRSVWSDYEFRDQFRRRALSLPKEMLPRDDWEWYFLMQHYRVPTRLLDWTEAALVALYFGLQACEERLLRRDGDALREGHRPAVWVVDPEAVNSHLEFEGAVSPDWFDLGSYLPRLYSKAQLPEKPVAIDPPYLAQRVMVQRSHFSLHGSDDGPLEEMSYLRNGHGLMKVVVAVDDRDALGHMRWQLRLLGITETVIFPDMEGLARELNQEYQT